MFVDINDTDGICVGDILYLKECKRTRSEYWWYAVREEYMDIARLAMLVDDVDLSSELGEFLDLL